MKKIRVFWLLLLMVCGMALAAPFPLLAQEVRTDIIMSLVPGYNNARAIPGEDNKAFLEIRNIGTRTVNNIRLTADNLPEGWTMEFTPGRIDSLIGGAVQTVDVNIRPPSTTAEGDYSISIIAQADELRKVSPVFVNVRKPATHWLWIGGVLGAIVIAVFVVIFVRMSKN